jgi:hypothetical protein
MTGATTAQTSIDILLPDAPCSFSWGSPASHSLLQQSPASHAKRGALHKTRAADLMHSVLTASKSHAGVSALGLTGVRAIWQA